jgi:hypothetical protein
LAHSKCPNQFPHGLLYSAHFEKILGYCKVISRKLKNLGHSKCPYNIPGFFQNVLNTVNHGETGWGILNAPIGKTTRTFFQKIQGLPTYYLIRTLWSHHLGNFECTEQLLFE